MGTHFPSYYAAPEGITIKQISDRWKINGEKIYDSSMPLWLSVDDLWKYRDYDWSRETARSGFGLPYLKYPDQKPLPGPEKWDAMHKSFQQHGWEDSEPAMLFVDKLGTAKLGEGNHRLAVWRAQGQKLAPVRVFFYQKNIPTSDTSFNPRQVEFKQWLNSQTLVQS